MNTSSFLSTLRAHSGLPLVFKAGADIVSPGYHLTEVKEVTFRTMDCGAMTHRWTENHFELAGSSTASEADDRGHMAAGKYLRIVDRVQKEIPLDGDADAKIFARMGDHQAAVHAVEAIIREGDRLIVSLRADRPRCKASERRAANGNSCGCSPKQGTEAAPVAAACCT